MLYAIREKYRNKLQSSWIDIQARLTKTSRIENEFRRLFDVYYGRRALAVRDNGSILPDVIGLETRTRCNGICRFCPCSVQAESRTDVTMETAVFEKVVADLASYGFSGQFTLALNNEPLLDDRIFDFVSLARRRLPCATLKIITNGTLLTVDKMVRLVEAGLNIAQINNYLSSKSQDARLTEVYRQARRRYPDLVINLEQERSFDETEGKFNRGGKIQKDGSRMAPPDTDYRISNRFPCFRPFSSLTVTADGSVGFCSADVYFDLKCGNVQEDNIIRLWHNDKATAIRDSLLKSDRSFATCCRYCNEFYFMDNLTRQVAIDVRARQRHKRLQQVYHRMTSHFHA